MEFRNLAEFAKAFPTEKAARQHFEAVRFENGDFCPHCGNEGINRYADGLRYRCKACKRDFTIKTGTIFEESRMGLRTWFLAIWLLSTNKKGIASMNLARQLGVTQQTAWFMDHRIRSAMGPDEEKLSGTVEIDETYIGGKTREKTGRFRNKSQILGMVERGGRIKAEVIPYKQTHILLRAVHRNVEAGAELITDGWRDYRKTPKLGYTHHWVNHGTKEFLRGGMHTGTIDGFWGQFKRGYHGTYHWMSDKHLQKYVDEFAYRYNRRGQKIADIFSETLSRMAERAKLSYKELIHEPKAGNSQTP